MLKKLMLLMIYYNKNDYVTNVSLTSRLNDLKSQHIATEVKTIDDKN